METIDCWLTSRDLLSPIRAMAEQLSRMDGVGRITIVDCDSSYEPLLEWYGGQKDFRVLRCENLGNHAPWQCDDPLPKTGYYFASDGDLDLDGVPRDFLVRMREALEKYPDVIKVAPSLRLDDLPEEGRHTAAVRNHEEKFWTRSRDETWFEADVDTTGCLYRGGNGWRGYSPALRAKPPYVARHVAWYVVEPTDEWQHYLSRLNPQGLTWSPRMRPSS